MNQSNQNLALIQCPLCGHRFEKGEGQETLCQSCPLNKDNCNFEKCPQCGFDIPQTSALWSFLLKAGKKLKIVKKGIANA